MVCLGGLERITDLNETLTLPQQVKCLRQTIFQNLFQMRIGRVAAGDPQDLRRRTKLVEQHQKIAVFCHDHGPSVSCRLKNPLVFCTMESHFTHSATLESESCSYPSGEGWRQLRINPNNQAATTGWSSRRLANRRHARISSASRSGNS